MKTKCHIYYFHGREKILVMSLNEHFTMSLYLEANLFYNSFVKIRFEFLT